MLNLGLSRVAVVDLNPDWLKAVRIQAPEAEVAWAVFYAGRVYGVHPSLSAAYSQLAQIEKDLGIGNEPKIQDTVSQHIKAMLDSVKDVSSSKKSKAKIKPN